MTWRALFAAGAIVLAACGDDGGAGGDGGPDGDGGSDGDGGVQSAGFADSFETWPVPASGTTEGFYAPGLIGPSQYWSTIDMDGDGLVDLVHTADPMTVPVSVWDEDDEAHWRVYLNLGDGFESSATQWPVPDSESTRGFFRSAAGASWRVLDIDGDDLPDLVQFTDPVTDVPWDFQTASHWRVYLNTGSGFSPTAMTWTLPTDPLPSGFRDSASNNANIGRWVTTDIDGDDLPDLVHTAEAGTPTVVWEVDTDPHWKVYTNMGSGFATTEVRWSVPMIEGMPRGFIRFDDPGWTTFDIDGDGALELVVTENVGDAERTVLYDGVLPVWHVYRSQSPGFATTFETWTVPLNSHAEGYFSSDIAENGLIWSTVDVDSDGIRDLVHTAIVGGATPAAWGSPSSDQWKVFHGDSDGFDAVVTSWSIPDNGLDDGFYALDESSDERSWMTLDIDGDGALELVQTADSASATPLVWGGDESAHWRVYRQR
jgi:hypothetical protein